MQHKTYLNYQIKTTMHMNNINVKELLLFSTYLVSLSKNDCESLVNQLHLKNPNIPKESLSAVVHGMRNYMQKNLEIPNPDSFYNNCELRYVTKKFRISTPDNKRKLVECGKSILVSKE